MSREELTHSSVISASNLVDDIEDDAKIALDHWSVWQAKVGKRIQEEQAGGGSRQQNMEGLWNLDVEAWGSMKGKEVGSKAQSGSGLLRFQEEGKMEPKSRMMSGEGLRTSEVGLQSEASKQRWMGEQDRDQFASDCAKKNGKGVGPLIKRGFDFLFPFFVSTNSLFFLFI